MNYGCLPITCEVCGYWVSGGNQCADCDGELHRECAGYHDCVNEQEQNQEESHGERREKGIDRDGKSPAA